MGPCFKRTEREQGCMNRPSESDQDCGPLLAGIRSSRELYTGRLQHGSW